MENKNIIEGTKQEYRDAVRELGKKEFTFLKMQEYGFWPEHLATPFERQKEETEEDYQERIRLGKEYEKLAEQIAALYQEKTELVNKLKALKKEFSETWDDSRIRNEIAKEIMAESIARRVERKKQKELEKRNQSEAWKKKKAENIVFIGKGYSGLLSDRVNDIKKLEENELPIIENDYALANFLGITYPELRFLTYHRDVVTADHYHRYTVPKKSGGMRNIAAPKPLLKAVQKRILEQILEKIEVSSYAHGFLKGRSVITGADSHCKQPQLLINMDIENFFPSVTFERVRGVFRSFGYSGYIASLLAMLCTDCDRMPIEIKGEIKYVKRAERVLPQGSPASPMITNIICRRLDENLQRLSKKYGCQYSRYADDMSFSLEQDRSKGELKRLLFLIEETIKKQGFQVNRRKTRCLRQNNRQCVTGIVMNTNQIGVPKKWVKNVRAAIYNAQKKKAEGTLSADMAHEISGMICWLKAVNEERYQKIIVEGTQLLKG